MFLILQLLVKIRISFSLKLIAQFSPLTLKLCELCEFSLFHQNLLNLFNVSNIFHDNI